MLYKLAYTGLVLLVYILGRCIPLYGIDTSPNRIGYASAGEMWIQTIGGDAYRSSVFTLGVFPYMISGLIVQIFIACRNLISDTKISPGKVRRASVTVTLIIAVLQAFSQVKQLKFRVTGDMLPAAGGIVVIEMITGVMLIMWLSDRNAKYGFGGRMLFALVNILDRIMATVSGHTIQSLAIPLALAAMMMVITLVMENAEKRIPVQRISIHNIYADKNYMAVKLNPVGVMPVMFSTMLFMLPQLLVSLFRILFPENAGIMWWQENMSMSKPFGIAVYIVCEYLLTFGLTLMMISPKDVTEQFLKSGDSIVDIHAGRDTRRYLRSVVCRISFFSATVMGVCMGVPLVMQIEGNIDSTLVMLPSSVMILTSFWCGFFREYRTISNYDACRALF